MYTCDALGESYRILSLVTYYIFTHQMAALMHRFPLSNLSGLQTLLRVANLSCNLSQTYLNNWKYLVKSTNFSSTRKRPTVRWGSWEKYLGAMSFPAKSRQCGEVKGVPPSSQQVVLLLGERTGLPQRGLGRSAGRKRILAYFEGHRTLFWLHLYPDALSSWNSVSAVSCHIC